MAESLIRARAPLRLGLGGGGTDTSPYAETYGGVVLNATVDLYANVTLRPCEGRQVALHLDDRDITWRGPAEGALPLGGETDLLKGVYNRFCAQFNGGQGLALEINAHADVPPGSGLGTSSAMVVALVKAFDELFQTRMSPYDVAHMAFEIEREELKLNGGKQDQYAAAFGGLNFIEFGPGDGVLVNPLRIAPEVVAEIEASLILFFSGVSRESARIIDEQSRNIAAGQTESIEAMHRLKEIAYRMKQALLRGRVAEVGEILDEGWVQKKRIASVISTPGLDAVYNAAKDAGAIGGKVSGAGGGGFMMFIVDPRKRRQVMRALDAQPGHVFASGLTQGGAMSWRIGDDLRKAASLAA
ncbi:dehydrogenase [Terricaulis sp.]|uniref:GHMP family kinase ATP-binding protein n=1 Tax=Terricaulis sp. TaxID=2768686 RepID=UPI003784B0B8